MKRNKARLIVVITILLGIVIAVLVWRYAVQRIAMHVEIGNHTGFVVTNESLDFGMITIHTPVKKNITIANPIPRPIKVSLYPTGELASWTHLSQKKLTIPAGGNETVTVQIIPPNTARYGNYTGTLWVLIR